LGEQKERYNEESQLELLARDGNGAKKRAYRSIGMSDPKYRFRGTRNFSVRSAK
jgi:hypothetical protein